MLSPSPTVDPPLSVRDSDESPWYASAPDDGLWDEATERFTLRLDGIPPGDHLLKARAIDSLGNSVSATRTLRVGR